MTARARSGIDDLLQHSGLAAGPQEHGANPCHIKEPALWSGASS